MKRYNDDFDNKILVLLADGNKQIQIAEKIGVSRAEISRRIKAMRDRGVEIPKTTKGRANNSNTTESNETDTQEENLLEGVQKKN